MSDDRLKRRVKYGALAGAVLSLVCHMLPPHYQTVCHAVAAICTGNR